MIFITEFGHCERYADGNPSDFCSQGLQYSLPFIRARIDHVFLHQLTQCMGAPAGSLPEKLRRTMPDKTVSYFYQDVKDGRMKSFPVQQAY
jgi:hypothetical protein